MKKIVALIANVIMAAVLFAEAPELKNMMPNSWRKLTRLSEQEENELQKKINISDYYDEYRSRILVENKDKVKIKIYEENCGSMTIYRVLSSLKEISEIKGLPERKPKEEDIKDYFDYNYYIYETDFIKLKQGYMPLLSASYNYEQATISGYGIIFQNIMYRKLNNGDIGIFYTEALVNLELSDNELIYDKCKGQPMGYSSCRFYVLSDFTATSEKINNPVKIGSSQYLFDSKCPLKYSIQNAFDGNPATSYVENTNDDLMKISFSVYGTKYSKETRINIINGYAASENLYTANNRIKTLAAIGYKISASGDEMIPQNSIPLELKDKNMGRQTVDFYFNNRIGEFDFKVTELYKGKTYNDTCLAEFNISEYGEWLFGDIDE